MLTIIAKSGLRSRLYDSIPTEIYALVLYRYKLKDCEISAITKIPISLQKPYSELVSKDFQKDLKVYKTILDAQLNKRSKSDSKDK